MHKLLLGDWFSLDGRIADCLLAVTHFGMRVLPHRGNSELHQCLYGIEMRFLSLGISSCIYRLSVQMCVCFKAPKT